MARGMEKCATCGLVHMRGLCCPPSVPIGLAGSGQFNHTHLADPLHLTGPRRPQRAQRAPFYARRRTGLAGRLAGLNAVRGAGLARAARLNHAWGPGPGPPQFPHDLFACIQSRRLAVWPPASTGRSSAPSRGRHCGVSKNWGPTSAASGQHLAHRPPQQRKKERMLWRQCLRQR